jgi:hypothetical protein
MRAGSNTLSLASIAMLCWPSFIRAWSVTWYETTDCTEQDGGAGNLGTWSGT